MVTLSQAMTVNNKEEMKFDEFIFTKYNTTSQTVIRFNKEHVLF